MVWQLWHFGVQFSSVHSSTHVLRGCPRRLYWRDESYSQLEIVDDLWMDSIDVVELSSRQLEQRQRSSVGQAWLFWFVEQTDHLAQPNGDWNLLKFTWETWLNVGDHVKSVGQTKADLQVVVICSLWIECVWCNVVLVVSWCGFSVCAVPLSPVSHASSRRSTSAVTSNSKKRKVIWDNLQKSVSHCVLIPGRVTFC